MNQTPKEKMPPQSHARRWTSAWAVVLLSSATFVVAGTALCLLLSDSLMQNWSDGLVLALLGTWYALPLLVAIALACTRRTRRLSSATGLGWLIGIVIGLIATFVTFARTTTLN